VKRILCVVLTLTLLCGMLPAAYAETISAYVISDTLKVYQNANTSSKLLGTLKKNDVVMVIAVNGGWCHVRNTKGATGYCMKSCLEKAWTGSAKGYVVSDSLTICATSSTSAKQLGTMRRGNVLTVTRVVGEWAQVKNGKARSAIAR